MNIYKALYVTFLLCLGAVQAQTLESYDRYFELEGFAVNYETDFGQGPTAFTFAYAELVGQGETPWTYAELPQALGGGFARLANYVNPASGLSLQLSNENAAAVSLSLHANFADAKAFAGLELTNSLLGTDGYRFVIDAANEARVLRSAEDGWQTVASVPVDKRYPHSLTVLFATQTMTFHLDGQPVAELAKPDATLQTSLAAAGRGVIYLHHYGLYYHAPGEAQTIFPASLNDKTYWDEAASDLGACLDSATFRTLWLDRPPAWAPETSGWKRYESETFGYAFRYPPDWTISSLDAVEGGLVMGFEGVDGTRSREFSFFATFVAAEFGFDDLVAITNEPPPDFIDSDVLCTLADPFLDKLLRVVSDGRRIHATFAALSGPENERLAAFHKVSALDGQLVDTLLGVYAPVYTDMND